MTADPRVQHRKNHLISEAQVTLRAIHGLGKDRPDPLADPAVLARAVTTGILDAPHLRNNPFGRGIINTRMDAGACIAIDSSGKPLSEAERLKNRSPS
jgi:hypothetical protein